MAAGTSLTRPLPFGCDELRLIVRNMDMTHESLVQRFSAEELVCIFRAQLRSEWDILPDRWSEAQLVAARDHGAVPTFDDDGKPVCR